MVTINMLYGYTSNHICASIFLNSNIRTGWLKLLWLVHPYLGFGSGARVVLAHYHAYPLGITNDGHPTYKHPLLLDLKLLVDPVQFECHNCALCFLFHISVVPSLLVVLFLDSGLGFLRSWASLDLVIVRRHPDKSHS